MSGIDEEILKAKKQMAAAQEKAQSEENLEKELKESIFDGMIHIHEQEVTFSEREIKDLGIRIYMPDAFFQFNNDLKNLLYPMGKNPKYVFGGEDITFQLAVDCTDNMVPDDGIPKFLPMAKKILETLGPKTRVIGTGNVIIDNRNVAIMEFVSRAVDTNVYNVMFYFSRNNHLMIGTVNFPSKHQKRFIKVAKEIIDSLKIIEEEV